MAPFDQRCLGVGISRLNGSRPRQGLVLCLKKSNHRVWNPLLCAWLAPANCSFRGHLFKCQGCIPSFVRIEDLPGAIRYRVNPCPQRSATWPAPKIFEGAASQCAHVSGCKAWVASFWVAALQAYLLNRPLPKVQQSRQPDASAPASQLKWQERTFAASVPKAGAPLMHKLSVPVLHMRLLWRGRCATTANRTASKPGSCAAWRLINAIKLLILFVFIEIARLLFSDSGSLAIKTAPNICG